MILAILVGVTWTHITWQRVLGHGGAAFACDACQARAAEPTARARSPPRPVESTVPGRFTHSLRDVRSECIPPRMADVGRLASPPVFRRPVPRDGASADGWPIATIRDGP